MEGKLQSRPSARWLQRRVDRKGLRPRYAVYVVIAFWTVAIVVFGVVERLVDPSTFSSIWLGIWWATQTVTTVGYGDVVPGSTLGKAIACLLMLGGLSLVAVVTAAVTSAFVTRAAADRRAAGDDPVMQRLDQLGGQLDELKGDITRLQQRDGETG